jgi:translation initiation factor 2B subunit (eIF-2B alpha/beta/delta family)
MKFAFIPKAQYKINQIITVHGKKMRVVAYSHTGKNVEVVTLENAPKFERIMCICTDAEPITAII